ncbi:cytochrome P450, partial [Panaeolus papilionaceus]
SKLPPGPTGTLFSGVKHLLPAAEPWKKYFAWSQHFDSPVISFRVFNKRIVVLNDYRSVEALLDNRATIYSDRPMSWMYNVICGRGNAIFNISASNPRHKAYRRLLSQGLGTKGTKLAWPILQNEVDTLLGGLSSAPDDW